MRRQGLPVDLDRMCLDRDYAHECLALAHAGGEPLLRRAALDLFDAYDRNADARAMH